MPDEIAAATGNQQEILTFLENPASYPGGQSVERIDTHASIVFLAGDRAYKVKRAVRYEYLDFSTVPLREQACRGELALNRRTAPAIYLGVEPLFRSASGALTWSPPGAIVEWVLVMQRFDQDALLDRIAERGALTVPMMQALAREIARFHEAAERTASHGGRAGMAWVVDGNAVDFARYERVLDAERCRAVTGLCRDWLARQGDLLDARRRDGFVRRCHGDLHLRNIVLLDGQPTLFDGVEFNDDISCVDVLYDLAFLLMDLWRRRLPAQANAVLNRYLGDSGDLAGVPLLPLFLGCRAAIRAKTSATAAGMQADEAGARQLGETARDYLTMAERLLHPPAPVLVAVGGFSGSGKSTLAAHLAPDLGREPGAIVLRSDVIRKALRGVAEDARLADEAYTPEATRQVYAAIAERAALALRGGQAVIADAVYSDPRERAAIADVAARVGVPFAGLWLDASFQTLASRVATRTDDASDATAAVVTRQLAAGAGTLGWHRIDASGSPASTERLARLVLPDAASPAAGG